LNSSVKLITKILANRLHSVILQVIYQNQYGLLKNRSIQDCLPGPLNIFIFVTNQKSNWFSLS
jgi:hypothetical protein